MRCKAPDIEADAVLALLESGWSHGTFCFTGTGLERGSAQRPAPSAHSGSYRSYLPHSNYLSFHTNYSLISTPMSQNIPTTPSTRFQIIFNDALEEYKKRTKNDLTAHPLATQLQLCDCPSAVLTVLQDQVGEPQQSRSNDERLTKWLGPTVNILFALSATLGEGVGLVNSKMVSRSASWV